MKTRPTESWKKSSISRKEDIINTHSPPLETTWAQEGTKYFQMNKLSMAKIAILASSQ